MLKLNSVVCFFLVVAFTYGQEPDCKKFKTGKYKIIDSKSRNIISVMTDSSLTYYNEQTRLKANYDLEWTNDCTYTLKNYKIVENPDNFEPHQTGIIHTCEIVKTEKKSFSVKCAESNFNRVTITQVFLIE